MAQFHINSDRKSKICTLLKSIFRRFSQSFSLFRRFLFVSAETKSFGVSAKNRTETKPKRFGLVRPNLRPKQLFRSYTRFGHLRSGLLRFGHLRSRLLRFGLLRFGHLRSGLLRFVCQNLNGYQTLCKVNKTLERGKRGLCILLRLILQDRLFPLLKFATIMYCSYTFVL